MDTLTSPSFYTTIAALCLIGSAFAPKEGKLRLALVTAAAVFGLISVIVTALNRQAEEEPQDV